MYHVIAQGVDERAINVHYYYYLLLTTAKEQKQRANNQNWTELRLNASYTVYGLSAGEGGGAWGNAVRRRCAGSGGGGAGGREGWDGDGMRGPGRGGPA